MVKKIVHIAITTLKKIIYHIKLILSRAYYKLIFKSIGSNVTIISPLHIDGGENIIIEDEVFIQYKTWLAALPLTNEKTCLLHIKNGVVIGHFNHIYATKYILIEENVLIADKVYISDNIHEYNNINIAIKKQPVRQKNDVIIGANSWLGENVCVLGAKIGRHCVIGANSVVTSNIPDYCIAVGSPAKIIKRYSFSERKWCKTDLRGNFINSIK